MILNKHLLTNKMPIKAFTAHTKDLRNHMGIYDTYSRAFQNFLSALDALSNE